jgi:hypothetical protein
MVDLAKAKRRSSRINEETLFEKITTKKEHDFGAKSQNSEVSASVSSQDNTEESEPDYEIPTFKKETRGRKAKGYSHEPTRKLSVDLPISVFKALSRLCIDEEITKTDFVPELIIKELKKKKYL